MPVCYQLIQRSNPELATFGVAAVYLACAEDLPGAENLDIPYCLNWIKSAAFQVDQTTERLLPRFHRDCPLFKDSEAYFRMLCLVTVLQRDLGVYADDKLNDNPDCSNSEDLFLHGIVHGKGGTCSSLPVLYAAVGRELGYPIRLARTAHHLFARWDDPGGERFNIECTVPGLDTPSDEYYLTWPTIALPEEVKAGHFLKSLTPREELAGFLVQRAYCLLHNNRNLEAVESCIGACIAAPANKLNERSTVKIMQAWQAKLRRLLPPLFPEVVIHPSPNRRFPERIPREVERDILELEVMQDLLVDAEKEQRWWRHLRWYPLEWPRDVPTRIDVSMNHEPVFASERNIS